MATAVEIGQALATALAPILEGITRLSTQNQSSNRGMVDTRGIGRPPSFDGQDKSWREWRGKVTAYLYATDESAEESLQWVDLQGAVITSDRVRTACTSPTGDLDQLGVDKVMAFSKKLFLILSDVCKGEPFRMVESAGYGNGLEAWRVLLRRYASKTPGTKRALLQSLFTMKPATSVETFEALLLNMEEMVRRYDGMAEVAMTEDIKCAILVACCPKDLKEYLDMSSEDFVYSDLRSKVGTWVERKREQQPKNLQQMEANNSQRAVPMEVGMAQWGEDHWYEYPVNAVQDWGGSPDWYTQSQHSADNQLTEEEMSYMPKGGKAKGKGKGKGRDAWKGGKGNEKGKGGKGGGKGKGGNEGGTGKGTYQGHCHWCGIWGHTARYCRQKDAYMDEQRRLWAQAGAANVEQEDWCAHENKEDAGGIGGLEAGAPGTWRDLGGFELGSLLRSNRFAALASEGSGDESDDIQNVPCQVHTVAVQCALNVPKTSPAKDKMPRVTKRSQWVPLSNLELMNLDQESQQLDLTIDSGAAEHVIGPDTLPHIPTQPSEGSKNGVHYVTANGTKMANQGEQVISAKTCSGQACRFKLQVTNVRRPLMSVGRICDAGHRVVFGANGGYIQSVATGERVPFRRDNNVYRLGVTVPGVGFHRQGQQDL